MRHLSVRHTPAVLVYLIAALAAATACKRTQPLPPVATATLTLNHDEAPLGAPVEMTFKFVVAPDAHFDGNYRVMVHVVDADQGFMWADDFDPPTPTSQWRPGQTVEFTRTTFLPIYPYVGDATIEIGLYSPTAKRRLALNADDMGQQAYRGAHLRLLPQTDSVFVVYKDGWQSVEVAPDEPGVEWQWSKGDGVLAFKNPKKACVLYLDLDNPGIEQLGPQRVSVTIGDKTIDAFTLDKPGRILRRAPIPADAFGDADMVEMHVIVDKTFVPAKLDPDHSTDARELGVRVFHAYVDNRG